MDIVQLSGIENHSSVDITPDTEELTDIATMDLNPTELICVCGRSFYDYSALSKHKRSCKKSKTRLAGALGKAKELWQSRKRHRSEQAANASEAGSDFLGGRFGGTNMETEVYANDFNRLW